ncbi:tetratricopeptide repeat protein [Gracilibacillus xinjiangensis]|uniref:Tetratricopeptide repeat protein n=1 Tax=Gracilibacillus xinjiangensis TaxID=1193282 RepID=A0ABV8WNT5_9BACI
MTTIKLIHHKKEIKMNVKHLTIYKQAKIVEMIDANQQYFTAIFYKNKFINAKKLNAMKLQSFLTNAYTNGNQYPSNHPLTRAFLNTNKKYRITTSNQMFQNLKDKYADIEMLYVLSMFDNFLDHRKIRALCKKIFYQYRRNGQMKMAFRTIVNYIQIRPHDRFATDMIHHMDFQKYQESYQDFNTMVTKWADPLYIEATAVNFLTSNPINDQLFQFYDKEERWFDALALYYQLFQTQKFPIETHKLDNFEALLNKINNNEIIVSFWEELLKVNPASDRILKKLADNHANDAVIANMLMSNNGIQLDVFEKALLTVDGEFLFHYKDQLFSYIIKNFKNDQTKMEKLVHYCMRKLLPHISITEMLGYLEQIELPVTTKLKNMKQLEQNPDKQFVLGELYYQLEQYDKAIKCFEWEMELSPDDPKPLQYLQKSYNAIGDKTTAKNYQDLLVNITSRSKTS